MLIGTTSCHGETHVYVCVWNRYVDTISLAPLTVERKRRKKTTTKTSVTQLAAALQLIEVTGSVTKWHVSRVEERSAPSVHIHRLQAMTSPNFSRALSLRAGSHWETEVSINWSVHLHQLFLSHAWRHDSLSGVKSVVHFACVWIDGVLDHCRSG